MTDAFRPMGGWQILPEQATPEMEAAAQTFIKGFHDIPDRDWRTWTPKDMFRLAWKAMIAAAPKPPIVNVGLSWQPISTARKDRSLIWALLREDIFPHLAGGQEHLRGWNGAQVPLRHSGIAKDGFDMGWNVAAPVGFGGLPDEWIAGWMPPPSSIQPNFETMV